MQIQNPQRAQVPLKTLKFVNSLEHPSSLGNKGQQTAETHPHQVQKDSDDSFYAFCTSVVSIPLSIFSHV